MDGHFCGHCGSAISRAVGEALEGVDVDGVTGDVQDVTVGKDGLLYIRAHREGDHEPHREAHGEEVSPGA